MDGFILKTNNGETLKAFVEPKFVKQINAQLAKGDDVSIKIYNSAYWKDNEYPVLTSFKLNKGDKLLMDRWPKSVSNQFKSNNMTDGELVSPYSERKKIMPHLLTSTNLKVDTKNNISYVSDGKYKIGDIELDAKESIFDKSKNTIKARKATITKNGHMIVSEEINVDVNTNYFTVKEVKEPFRLSTFNKVVTSSQPRDFEKKRPKLTGLNLQKPSLDVAKNKISYSYKDSTKIDKANNTVYLYGKAQISVDKNLYEGSSIVYNKKLNTIKAYDARITEKGSKSIFTADSLYLDLNSSKGRFFGMGQVSY
ncbi:MAG: hypothetical protein EOO47_11650 [Flavobacterium sp.]|nr:MAG: hypothetical protein EOO47_11650 [Flavobacterium sp.]